MDRTLWNIVGALLAVAILIWIMLMVADGRIG